MKKLVLALSLIIFFGNSFSQNVSVSQSTAETIALNYIKAVDKSNSTYTIETITTKTTDDGTILYYVINFKNNGFVIVAGDKRIDPIIAYSTENKYIIGKVDACETFMNACERNIADVINSNEIVSETVNANWDNIYKGKIRKEDNTGIKLLTSQWNQDKYYNALCPYIYENEKALSGYDNHVPNGCVAVAMAQIIYYHRYPQSGFGNSSYKSNYGRLRADYANTIYDYDAMADVATGYSDALARLIYHCGVSVEMDYDPEGSGTQSSEVPSALKGRFLYNGADLKSKSGYSDDEWFNMIKTDIDNGLPIYYSAHTGGTETHAGHAFICDGYDNTKKIHINWGWGGYNDGYFSLSDMKGYTLANQAIFNIKPKYDTTNFFTGVKTLTATYGSFNDGSCRLQYKNNTNCAWLIAPEGNVTKITLSLAKFATEDENDVVTIYNGSDTSGTVVATLSGIIDENRTYTINGPKAYIRFTSNESITSEGFHFNYTTERNSANYCSSTTTPIKKTDESGTITDGSNNNNYENNKYCYWSIAPKNATNKVGLIFRKFDLGQGDILEIYKPGSAVAITYPKHGQYSFSNENPPTLDSAYIVNSNVAYIRFNADNNISGEGWEIEWFGNVSVTESENGFTDISVYPNPANSILNIAIQLKEEQQTNIELFSIMGQKVYEQHYYGNQINTSIYTSDLAKGIYMLKITTSNGTTTRSVCIQ